MSIYSFENRAETPWPNPVLDRAVIIGHTTPTSSRIWVRTGKIGDFLLLVFDRNVDNLGDIYTQLRDEPSIKETDLAPFNSRAFTVSNEERDYIEVLDIDNLSPDTQYTYAVLEKIKEGEWRFILGHEKRRRFRTPQPQGPYAFGLFSCHNPYKKGKRKTSKKSIMGSRSLPDIVNMDVWNSAQEAFSRTRKDCNVGFLIAGGDQAYCDGCDDLNLWTYLEKCIKDRNKPGRRLPNKQEMLSWYRDMYRGYWGFPQVKSIFGQHPTYMIWDDHEIRDGWGSHKLSGDELEINEVLFDDWKDYLSEAEAKEIIYDMVAAAKQAYEEYEHSHNPPTAEGEYDYTFEPPNSLFYVLDGRGYRDFGAGEYKILGKEQMERFRAKIDGLTAPGAGESKFLFVVSAVPVLHMKSSSLVNLIADISNVEDDLRDAWEYPAHDKERRMLLDILFAAAEKGIKVCILSGDVHVTAAFKMQRGQSVIYQLTSSAITYNTPRALAFGLGYMVEDDGESDDDYYFKRLSMLTDPSFAIIKVNPNVGNATFQVYKAQEIPNYEEPTSNQRKKRKGSLSGEATKVLFSHSATKIELNFQPD